MRLLFLVLFLTGCGTTAACSSNAVRDTSPSWRLAGRMTSQLGVDCNTPSANKSIGITGCAFVDGQVAGNLIMEPLYTGNLTGVSYNCKNFTAQADAINTNYFQWASLYTATNGQSCSWTITRTITEGNNTADDSMISRVFLKIIPKNPYYTKMNFSVGKINFSGVGWAQVKTSIQEVNNAPILTVTASGTKGTFRAYCGEELIISQPYTTKTFDVQIPETLKTCDVELSATNSDSSKIDLGSFVYNIAYSTIDLSAPIVTISKSKITFNFTDKVNGGYAVFGVKVNSTLCKAAHSCTAPLNVDLYQVKALTMGARLFVGNFRRSTNTWEIY